MERYSVIVVADETAPIRRYDILKSVVHRALWGAGLLVVLGWVPFRAHSLEGAWQMIETLHSPMASLAASGEAIMAFWLSAFALVLIGTIDAATLRLAEQRNGAVRRGSMPLSTQPQRR